MSTLCKQYQKRRITLAAMLQYLTRLEKYLESVDNEDTTVFYRLTSEEMLSEIVTLIQRTIDFNTIFNIEDTPTSETEDKCRKVITRMFNTIKAT